MLICFPDVFSANNEPANLSGVQNKPLILRAFLYQRNCNLNNKLAKLLMRHTNPVKGVMVVPQKLKMLKFLTAGFVGILERESTMMK